MPFCHLGLATVFALEQASVMRILNEQKTKLTVTRQDK